MNKKAGQRNGQRFYQTVGFYAILGGLALPWGFQAWASGPEQTLDLAESDAAGSSSIGSKERDEAFDLHRSQLIAKDRRHFYTELAKTRPNVESLYNYWKVVVYSDLPDRQKTLQKCVTACLSSFGMFMRIPRCSRKC